MMDAHDVGQRNWEFTGREYRAARILGIGISTRLVGTESRDKAVEFLYPGILALALVLICSASWSHAGSLAVPTAEYEIQNAVPMDLVSRVSLERAEEKWGQVTLGKVIPCCDLDGQVVCYAFVFRIGVGEYPGYEEILAGVIEGRKICEEAVSEMAEYPSRSAQAQRKLRHGIRRKWGIDEYGTVVVSARFDQIPVLEVTHGLHYYYCKGDLIRESAIKTLGNEAKLVTIYFSSPLDQGYRFTSGETEVVIDPFSLKILSDEQLRKTLGSKTVSTPDEELQSEIREEWARLRSGR